MAAPSAQADLSGDWTGTYSGDPPNVPGNSFEAWIVDSGGVLTGGIVEPDEETDIGILRADIRGTVAGGEVRFLKLYDGASHAAHGVDYRGRVSDNGCAIAGEWTFAAHSGIFEMRRRGGQAVVREIEEKAEVPVE